jgi:hypothetical protein
MRTLTSSVRMMRRTMPRPNESRTSESLPTTRPRPQRPPRSSLPVRSSRSPSLSSPYRSSLGMMRPTWSLWRRKLGPSRRTVSYGVPPSSFPSVTVSSPYSTHLNTTDKQVSRCSRSPWLWRTRSPSTISRRRLPSSRTTSSLPMLPVCLPILIMYSS